MRFDHWEEDTELCAVELLEESVKDIVVVEKVATALLLACLERALKLQEQGVQLAQDERPGARWLHACDLEHNLQPFLNIRLLVYRSQNFPDIIFVEHGVRATA